MIKRNIVGLDEIEEAIESGGKIELTKEKSIKAKCLIIIKRDGREEPYNVDKMRKVVFWACDKNEHLTNELLSDTEIKMYDKISIIHLYDELIKTASNKISLLYPQWEFIASKLLLMKIYKQSWGVGTGKYPHLREVLEKGVQHRIYDKSTVDSYDEDEINKLSKAIKQKRDFLFTYKALVTFTEKYCLNYSKTKNLELPQHVYMRVAMALRVNDNDRIPKIIETYNNLSQMMYTVATPIAINAMTPNQNLASCVLNAMEDDSHSILDTNKNLGIYSKYKGGTAVDVSRLRAKGSYILGNQGASSGAVPFIKIVESTMKAFNQGGKRAGACAVYFQWWHIDFDDLIVLKSNGGTDENRARGLKYTVKLNDLFIERVKNDEEITLFDPKDTPALFNIWGKDFEDMYEHYEQKSGIRKKRVKAREVWYKIMKERTETGNIYLFHEENVNDANMTGRYINSSNLCVSGDTEITIQRNTGEIETIEIKELDNELLYVNVLSKDLDNNKDVFSKINDFQMTNKSAKIMKITDEESGNFIKCTPDHKIWTENRGYIMAKNLLEIDKIVLCSEIVDV